MSISATPYPTITAEEAADLDAAVAAFREQLPGWSFIVMRIGDSKYGEASCCPKDNGPEAYLCHSSDSRFADGFHYNDLHRTTAHALRAITKEALAAREKVMLSAPRL